MNHLRLVAGPQGLDFVPYDLGLSRISRLIRTACNLVAEDRGQGVRPTEINLWEIPGLESFSVFPPLLQPNFVAVVPGVARVTDNWEYALPNDEQRTRFAEFVDEPYIAVQQANIAWYLQFHGLAVGEWTRPDGREVVGTAMAAIAGRTVRGWLFQFATSCPLIWRIESLLLLKPDFYARLFSRIALTTPIGLFDAIRRQGTNSNVLDRAPVLNLPGTSGPARELGQAMGRQLGNDPERILDLVAYGINFPGEPPRDVDEQLAAANERGRAILGPRQRLDGESVIDYLLAERNRRGAPRVWNLPGLEALEPSAPTSGDRNTYNFNDNLKAIGDRRMLQVVDEQKARGPVKPPGGLPPEFESQMGSMFRGTSTLPGVDDLVDARNTNLIGWDTHFAAAANHLVNAYPPVRQWIPMYVRAATGIQVQREAEDAAWDEQFNVRLNELSTGGAARPIDEQAIRQAGVQAVEVANKDPESPASHQGASRRVAEQIAVTPIEGEQRSPEFLLRQAKEFGRPIWLVPGLRGLQPPTDTEWGERLYFLFRRDPELYLKLLKNAYEIPREALSYVPWEERGKTKGHGFIELRKRLGESRALPQIVEWLYEGDPAPNDLPHWATQYAAMAGLLREDRELYSKLVMDEPVSEQEAARANAIMATYAATTDEIVERDQRVRAIAHEAAEARLQSARIAEGQEAESCPKHSIFGLAEFENPLCTYSTWVSAGAGVGAFLLTSWLARKVPDGGLPGVALAKLAIPVVGAGAGYYLTRRWTKGKKAANDELWAIARNAMLVGGGLFAVTFASHWYKIRQEVKNLRELLEEEVDNGKRVDGTWRPDRELANQIGDIMGRLAGLFWFPDTLGNWTDDNFIDKAREVIDGEAQAYGLTYDDLVRSPHEGFSSLKDQAEGVAKTTMLLVRESRDERTFTERLVT